MIYNIYVIPNQYAYKYTYSVFDDKGNTQGIFRTHNLEFNSGFF